MRGATSAAQLSHSSWLISIHAPHAGRDGHAGLFLRRQKHFNPRAPCGARPNASPFRFFATYFNPRAPCGARLSMVNASFLCYGISIHAPHAGRDGRIRVRCLSDLHFNPRAPCGARRCVLLSKFRSFIFQSTRPMRGATAKVYKITLHTFATKGNF